MARQTSIAVYHEIEASGLLSKRRFEVYTVLFHHGPLTAGEVWAFHLQGLGCQIDSVRPRMAELKERGVIREIGQRACQFSGKMALVWDVTDQLPVDPPPDVHKTKDQTIQELKQEIVWLEEENAFLRNEIK